MSVDSESITTIDARMRQRFYRFHLPHVHLASVFGDDWFALKAEAFARFFGTPLFLVAQTVIVAVCCGWASGGPKPPCAGAWRPWGSRSCKDCVLSVPTCGGLT